MKAAEKQAKLRYLAERGIENEAFLLSSEIQGLHEQLGSSYPYLPNSKYLLSIAGQMANLAEMMRFMESLDKAKKKK